MQNSRFFATLKLRSLVMLSSLCSIVSMPLRRPLQTDSDDWIPQLEQQQMEGTPPPTLSPLQAAEYIEKARRAFTKMVTSLNTLSVHAHLQPAVDSLKAEMNGLIDKLPPLEAHKAATDANYALNSLHGAMDYCQNALHHATETVARLSKDCTTAINNKEASLNGLVDAAIAQRISEGKIFEKAAVDGLVAAARTQGKDIALNGLQVIATRKTQLTTLGLPHPENDAVLEGDDAAFAALHTQAKTRITMMAGKGLSLNKAPSLVKRLAYSPNFDTDLKNCLEALAANGTTTTPTGEPLIGLGAGGGGTGGSGKRLIV